MTAGPLRLPHKEQRAGKNPKLDWNFAYLVKDNVHSKVHSKNQTNWPENPGHSFYHFFMIQLLEMKKVLQGLLTVTISLPSATYSESDASGYICNPHCIWQIYRTTSAKRSSWKELIIAAGKRSRLGVKSCLKFEWILIIIFKKFQTALL